MSEGYAIEIYFDPAVENQALKLPEKIRQMASGRRYYCYRDVLPFSTLVIMECIGVGLNTLYKAATLRGMSYRVFMVYCYAVAALLLLPSLFFSTRSTGLPLVNFSIVSKIGLLAIIGWLAQVLGYNGLIYSSPTLSSAIGNLFPGFTFILAVIFRMETLSFASKSTCAKFFGTIVSLIGAFVVTLYKGPKLISNQPLSPSVSLHSSQSNWAIGGLLITSQHFLGALWNIVLTQVMKEFPAELTVIFVYNLIVCILATVFGVFAEPDSSSWRIKPDIALASILCSGVFSSFLTNVVHSWTLRLKGPLFVAMFKPLSIVIAVVMGVMFLGENLYLGSVIGATIISIGFYTVMWGKAKEDIMHDEVTNSESFLEPRLPLLQYYKDDDMQSSIVLHRSCV